MKFCSGDGECGREIFVANFNLRKCMKMKIAVAAILSVITTSSMAEDTGKFYIAGDFGSLTLSNTVAINPSAVLPNPKAFRVAGGYHYNQMLAVEAGYVIFGDSTLSAPGDSITLKNSAVQIAAVGSYPVGGSFDLIGKLGLSVNFNKFTGTGADAGLNTSNTSADLMYGVGVQYHISEQVSIRAQYENFGKSTVSENFGNSSWKMGATMTSLGMGYNF
jgi:OOP family OmpA-OmpF porin